MKSLLKKSYIMRDTTAKRKPRNFAQRILQIAKDTKINNIDSQLDIIYININLSLRIYLTRSIKRFTINLFLLNLNNRKYK